MSLEDAIAALTAAVKENTAAHAKLAEVAVATASAAADHKPTPADDAGDAGDTEAASPEEKKPRKTSTRKPRKAAAKKPEPPELEGAVGEDAIKKIAATFLGVDDDSVRDDRKEKVLAAFNHIGAKKLSDIDSDSDRARLAGYIAYWTAGLDVDFEAVDELVAGASEGGSDGDDLLG